MPTKAMAKAKKSLPNELLITIVTHALHRELDELIAHIKTSFDCVRTTHNPPRIYFPQEHEFVKAVQRLATISSATLKTAAAFINDQLASQNRLVKELSGKYNALLNVPVPLTALWRVGEEQLALLRFQDDVREELSIHEQTSLILKHIKWSIDAQASMVSGKSD